MFHFYALPTTLRFILQVGLLLGMGMELALVFMELFRRDRRYTAFGALFELSLGVETTVLNLSLGLVQILSLRNLTSSPYLLLRSAMIVVPLLGMPIFLLRHRNGDLLAMVLSILLLPFMENIYGTAAAVLEPLFSCLLLMRIFFVFGFSLRDMRHHLSRYSMKEAFDTFPEGLAIGRVRGSILLVNRQMRELLEAKGYAMDRRSAGLRRIFRWIVKREEVKARDNPSAMPNLNTLLAAFSGKSMAHRPTFPVGDRVYRYSEETFLIGRRSYMQIEISDISRENQLIMEIQKKNQKLEEGNRQLYELLKNSEEIETEKETRRMRNRIHDVMGQRLSIVHSTLQKMDRQRETPPLDELDRLLSGMVQDLNEPRHVDPRARLEHIRNTAEIVGTRVAVTGSLPTEEAVSEVFLQIIREAVTNAIRHGQASQVDCIFQESETVWELCIRNNGSVPQQQLREGEGISGMRHKLEAVRGELRIEAGKSFALRIRVPRPASR